MNESKGDEPNGDPERLSLSSNIKINLLNLTEKALSELLVEMGEKPFRAAQIFKWIHKFGFDQFDQMTDLSKVLREKLKTLFEMKAPDLAEEQSSADGTFKWLLRLEDGNFIETVFIPEKERGTLCVSSQVGCALNCSFCSTAKQGFNRNLTLSEIIGQIWLVSRRLSELSKNAMSALNALQITNVVMMGMGEPLLNFEAVTDALNIMRAENAYALSRRRVTLSTAGVVPKIQQLREVSDVSLAISLHAPNDELRNELVPLNKKYPIHELINACKQYIGTDHRRHVTIEYVMLKDVNDSFQQAKELCHVLKGLSCKVNLIPFNPHPGALYQRSDFITIQKFQTILMKAGLMTTLRKTRGQDIDAACGQLAGKIIDRTSRSARWKRLRVHIKERNEKEENTWMEKLA